MQLGKGLKKVGNPPKEKETELGFEARHKLIADYVAQYAVVVDAEYAIKLRPADWNRYIAIKQQILDLMKEADGIADLLREAASLVQEQQGHEIAGKV